MPSGLTTNRILVAVALAGTFAGLLAVADRFAKAGWSSQIDIALAVAVALVAGIVIEGNYRRVVRHVDRLFLPRRHARTVALDRIAASLRERHVAASQRVADDIGDSLGLESVAIFTRTDDDGFVRQAAFGWPYGSTWHLLPDDPLTLRLNQREQILALSDEVYRDAALPKGRARPCIALTVRRRSRVQSAILLGPDRSGGVLDAHTVRGLAAVLGEALAR